MWPESFAGSPRIGAHASASLKLLAYFANEKRLEMALDSKETVVDQARELRRAQKARIAAPCGPEKKQAKTHEHLVAKRLGYAVDNYERDLSMAGKAGQP
jgi:hypothetical protein